MRTLLLFVTLLLVSTSAFGRYLIKPDGNGMLSIYTVATAVYTDPADSHLNSSIISPADSRKVGIGQLRQILLDDQQNIRDYISYSFQAGILVPAGIASFGTGILAAALTANPFAVMPFAGIGSYVGYLANQAAISLGFAMHGKKVAKVISLDALDYMEGKIIKIPKQVESILYKALQKLKDNGDLSSNPAVDPVEELQ